ncbi:hypothetical protein V3481_019217 [Fusarium oxysporum f. sp. vasinfectum]
MIPIHGSTTFAKAIQPVLGNCVTIYTGIYKDKLEGKTLTIGEVAKDLRKEVERQTLIQPQKGHRVTKGVFGPTFAGESSTLSQTKAGTPEREIRPRDHGEASGRKRKARQGSPAARKRVASSADSDSRCQACEGNHAWHIHGYMNIHTDFRIFILYSTYLAKHIFI